MAKFTNECHFEGAQLIIGVQDDAKSYDARFLISTLLVYVARSDGSISDVESNKMIDLLATQLGIPSPEALNRLSGAIMMLSNDADIVTTLQEISQGMTNTEKHDVFRMMLEVIAADDKLDSSEITAITFAGQILGLSLDTIHSVLRANFLAQKNS